jgi:hypothetical protein
LAICETERILAGSRPWPARRLQPGGPHLLPQVVRGGTCAEPLEDLECRDLGIVIAIRAATAGGGMGQGSGQGLQLRFALWQGRRRRLDETPAGPSVPHALGLRTGPLAAMRDAWMEDETRQAAFNLFPIRGRGLCAS